MPLRSWKMLNNRIVKNGLNFEDIKDELLEIIEKLDELRKSGGIEEGIYRQRETTSKIRL